MTPFNNFGHGTKPPPECRTKKAGLFVFDPMIMLVGVHPCSIWFAHLANRSLSALWRVRCLCCCPVFYWAVGAAETIFIFVASIRRHTIPHLRRRLRPVLASNVAVRTFMQPEMDHSLFGHIQRPLLCAGADGGQKQPTRQKPVHFSIRFLCAGPRNIKWWGFAWNSLFHSHLFNFVLGASDRPFTPFSQTPIDCH